MLDHVKEEIESARQKAVQRARKIRMCGVASTPYLDYCHADIGQSNANIDYLALYNQKLDSTKKESIRKKEAFNMLLNSLDEEQKTIVSKELSSLSYDHDQLIVTLIESFDKTDEYSVLDAYRLLFSREQVLASFTDEQMELLKSTRGYMGGREEPAGLPPFFSICASVGLPRSGGAVRPMGTRVLERTNWVRVLRRCRTYRWSA